MELAVGLMLVLLGMLNLTGALQSLKAAIGHTGVSPRGNADLAADAGERPRGLDRLQVIRPVAVGIVHGLAGSAAVALLVLTTIQDPRWAMAYLLVFGAGTVAGMILVTMAIATPFATAPGAWPCRPARCEPRPASSASPSVSSSPTRSPSSTACSRRPRISNPDTARFIWEQEDSSPPKAGRGSSPASRSRR